MFHLTPLSLYGTEAATLNADAQIDPRPGLAMATQICVISLMFVVTTLRSLGLQLRQSDSTSPLAY